MLSLRTTLLVNATSSGAAGALLVLFSRPGSSLFSLNGTIAFTATGIFLLLFAAYVFNAASRKDINRGQVYFISILDLLWVAASLVTLLTFGNDLSGIGIILIAGVAAWVGLMAYLQLKGLKLYAHGNSL
jgi:hypothetical protein